MTMPVVRTNIDSGKLTGEFDANSLGIENVNRYVDTREIVIGIRSPNTLGVTSPGKGNWDSPFHVSSTASFMQKLNGLNNAYKWIIRVRDGAYTCGLWQLPDYCEVYGEGIGKSLITLDPETVLGGEDGVIGAATANQGDRIIDGFTVNTNWDELVAAGHHGNRAVGCIGVNGAAILRNIEALGCYGHIETGNESFALYIGKAIDGRAHMEYCVVDDFKGNYCNGMVIIHTFVTVLSKGATISKSIVRNAVTDTGHMSAFGLDGGVIDSVVSDNCNIGFYIENARNLHVLNSHFYNNRYYGVKLESTGVNPASETFPSGPYSVINNYIELRDDAPNTFSQGVAVSNDPVDHRRTWRNGKIMFNTIKELHTGNPITRPDYGYGILTRSTTPNAVEGLGDIVAFNQIETTLRNFVQPDTLLIGNRGLSAEVIGGMKSDQSLGPGLGLPDDFITEIPATPPNLFGAICSMANRTSPGGYWSHVLEMTPYVVANGDVLMVSVLCDSSSKSFIPGVSLLDASSNALGVNTLVDQTSRLGYSDLESVAKDVFFSRLFDLTPIVGSTVKFFSFGGSPYNTSGVNAASGISTYYFKRVQIVSSNGTVRRIIYMDTGAGAIALLAAANVSGVTAVPYYPTNLPETDPEKVGLLWSDPAADNVVKVSQG